ncbi:MAG: hypothetical protein ABEJ65_09995 [bacterium]
MEEIENRGERFNHSSWESIAQTRLDPEEDEWNSFDYYRQFLSYWTAYHVDLSRFGELSADVTPLLFSDQYETYVETFAEQHNGNAGIEDFAPKSRPRGGSYWSRPKFRKRCLL